MTAKDLFPSGLSIFFTLLILAVIAAEIGLLIFLKKHKFGEKKFKINHGFVVLVGLIFGVINGVLLQVLYTRIVADFAWGANDAMEWVDVLKTLFLNAFEILIVPLVLISIVRSILIAGSGKQTGRGALYILGTFIVTVAISALIGYGAARIFPIEVIIGKGAKNDPATIVDTVKSIIPKNFFSALTSNRALPVVFMAFVIGITAMSVRKNRPEIGEKFVTLAEMGYELVGTIVDYMIFLSPVGVLAIVTSTVATEDWHMLSSYGWFILAFFVATAVVFVMHIVVLLIFGVNIASYFKHAAKTYLFAFTSMSSFAALPLTVKSQRELGVSEGNANLAASLGTCVGQNACAGVYPAMIVTITAVTYGRADVNTIGFALLVVAMVTVSSIGASGAGGGNLQASLMALSLLGLDNKVFVFLYAVDFFVGIVRPPINAADSMVAGIVAQRIEDITSRFKKKKRLEAADESVQI